MGHEYEIHIQFYTSFSQVGFKNKSETYIEFLKEKRERETERSAFSSTHCAHSWVRGRERGRGEKERKSARLMA